MPAYTVKQKSETELVIKRSRFIGRCYPVQSEEEALQILERVRKECWDASHNCYAYVTGANGSVARYSDDGEPSGTAGMPIMEVLSHAAVHDVLIIVTRYFGGILLGTGGLVRAYGASASEALKAAGVMQRIPCRRWKLMVDYPLWGRVEQLLRSMAVMEDTVFGSAVEVTLWVKLSEEERLIKEITERSDGRLSPVFGETEVRLFETEE